MRGRGPIGPSAGPGPILLPAVQLCWGRCGFGDSLEEEKPVGNGPVVRRRAAARVCLRGAAVPVAVVVSASPPPFAVPVIVT